MNAFEGSLILLCLGVGLEAGRLAQREFGLFGLVIGFAVGTAIIPLLFHVGLRMHKKYRIGPLWPWF